MERQRNASPAQLLSKISLTIVSPFSTVIASSVLRDITADALGQFAESVIMASENTFAISVGTAGDNFASGNGHQLIPRKDITPPVFCFFFGLSPTHCSSITITPCLQ